MAVVLSISSQVTYGYVGNSAACLALQRLGHTACPIPTVTLAHHPGHGRAVVRMVTPAKTITDFIEALDRHGVLTTVDAVLVGYVADVAQADAITAAIRRLLATRPDVEVMLDPVMGDDGRLYVDEGIAAAIRDMLLPLAGIATPNVHELGWLSDTPIEGLESAVAAARKLGPSEVLVTSAPGASPRMVRTMTVTSASVFAADSAHIECTARGTGDLIAALYLGRRLAGASPETALGLSAGSVQAILAATSLSGLDELALIDAQDALTNAPPIIPNMLSCLAAD